MAMISDQSTGKVFFLLANEPTWYFLKNKINPCRSLYFASLQLVVNIIEWHFEMAFVRGGSVFIVFKSDVCEVKHDVVDAKHFPSGP